jgi:hypothetical protein
MRRPSDSSLTSELPRWGGEVVRRHRRAADQQQSHPGRRTLEKAHQKLIDELKKVRGRFDAADDDWQHSLLMVFREYCRMIGIERKLIDPLERMRLDVGDAILRKRRRDEGKGNARRMPAHKSAPLEVSAACVTVLKERGDYPNVDDAVRFVARATGIQRETIKGFRDNLSRRLVSEDVLQSYPNILAIVRQWPTAEMRKILADLHGYVK